MIKVLLLLLGLGQTTETMAPSKNHCLHSAQQWEHTDYIHLKGFMIPSVWCWRDLNNPYIWNFLFSFITSTMPLQAVILPLLFSSSSLFSYPWHLFFKKEIFFFWEITSKFQSRKKKAALESERVIIASGMEDRRKCQIKGLNFKRQEHSDRKRRWK